MTSRSKVALACASSLMVAAVAACWVRSAWADTKQPSEVASRGAVGPDVTVFSLSGTSNYGSSGGIRAYSLGTVSCNRGDSPLNWCDNFGGCGLGTTDEDHPVIAQNLYRLKDGRFEQIGMSWLKHGFVSTNSTTGGCTGATGQSCQPPPLGGNQLGVGCTDPYGSSLNGSRPLGPRSQVNASSGEFPFPHSGGSFPTPTAIEQRIQVKETDLDPTLNPEALYWMEGQYIAPDDAQMGNGLNNASYRPVTVGAAPNYNLTFSASTPTVERLPAIMAWQATDPGVEILGAEVPSSSPIERFHVGRRVTDLSGGLWHYEYVVHNLNSDRSARSFSVHFPDPTTFTNLGFHDVKHHSGEPYATTDWVADTSEINTVSWSTDDFATDANANALRWATLFSFWFDASSPPASFVEHTLGLFKPGSPPSVSFFMSGVIGTLIFQDGFETGDTSAWSFTIP